MTETIHKAAVDSLWRIVAIYEESSYSVDIFK